MSPPFRVVISDLMDDDLAPERAALEDIARLEALRATREEELIEHAADADGVMLWHSLHVTRKTLPRLTRCRIIVRMGVGFDNIDIDAAAECGIAVANVPDYGTEDVADTAIGLTLALARGICLLNGRLRGGAKPWSYELAAPLHRLRGRTFGIVGIGRIGTATALRAKAFGLDVVFHDPYVPHGAEKALGVRRAETLGELLKQSQILSLHCPLTAETRRLINDDTLAGLPRGAYLVNTARGAVVDTDAVARAIESGRLEGAGLDVLPEEPPAEDDPLLVAWRDPKHPAHHRVILNSHTAFYTEEGMKELRGKAARACRKALLGEPIPNLVNRPRSRP